MENGKKKFPSLIKQGTNLATAVGRVIATLADGDDVFVDSETKDMRTSICSSCDRLDKESMRCYECGCRIPNKIPFDTEGCPIGKW